jgi:AraC-like DNA-binding protein
VQCTAVILSALPDLRGWAAASRTAIGQSLPSGKPTLKRIAARLKVPSRRLQRLLVDHGIVFRKLADEVRREIAYHYVADPRLTSRELAFLLGYSNSGSFVRAFRRWSGCSYQEYRQGLTAPTPVPLEVR